MQRLHTIKLQDGTIVRLDMRHETWRLLPDVAGVPDLQPVPATKQLTQDDVRRQLQAHLQRILLDQRRHAVSCLRWQHRFLESWAAAAAAECKLLNHGSLSAGRHSIVQRGRAACSTQ